MDAAAERQVGAAESIERRGHELIPAAAHGLIVVERARADHQRRGRACGSAAENSAAGADAGPDRPGAVVAADGLVMAERAADDGEASGVLNGATGAGSA